jgi:hypothetical protein
MLEKALEDWMVRTKDPLLEVFRRREDAAFREAFMKSLEMKPKDRKERQAAQNALPKPPDAKALIELEIPKSVTAGQTVTVKLKHHFPLIP